MSGIKEAYTTRELAELKGVAPKNLLSRAKRENWTGRTRSGRGGGFEWLVSSMPEKTRLAIAYAGKPAEDAPATVAAPALPSTDAAIKNALCFRLGNSPFLYLRRFGQILFI